MKRLSDRPNCIDRRIMQRMNSLHIENDLKTCPADLIEWTKQYCVKDCPAIPSDFDWGLFFKSCGVRFGYCYEP